MTRDKPFVIESGGLRTCGLCGSRIDQGLMLLAWQKHYDLAHSEEAYQRAVNAQKSAQSKLAPSGKRHLRVVK